MEGRWTISTGDPSEWEGGVCSISGPACEHVPVVPCDDAAIERAAGRIRWECVQKGVRLHEDFIQTLAAGVLEAAGETP